jgi:hypothetical protein
VVAQILSSRPRSLTPTALRDSSRCASQKAVISSATSAGAWSRSTSGGDLAELDGSLEDSTGHVVATATATARVISIDGTRTGATGQGGRVS